jgi:hypothetical protein
MIHYLANLSRGKIILWCYLIWYLVNVYFYFDPSPSLWLNSLGISLIMGLALTLSVSPGSSKFPTEKRDPWQRFRLFFIPFCVSSFASLIKGQGFILVIPPKPTEQFIAVGSCLLFVGVVYGIKALRKSTPRS